METRMTLKYIKKKNGEVWRIVTNRPKGWASEKRIIGKTILAQEVIDNVNN